MWKLSLLTSSCVNVKLLIMSSLPLKWAKNFPNKYTKMLTTIFGSLPRKRLFDHKISSSSSVMGFACFCCLPRPAHVKHFIWESHESWNNFCRKSRNIQFSHFYFFSNTVVFQRRRIPHVMQWCWTLRKRYRTLPLLPYNKQKIK